MFQCYRDPNISLTSVAEVVDRSPSYLSRKFLEIFHVNYVELLNRIRVEHAKYLLMNSDMNLGEISQHVGILNARYFSSVFKRSTGVTPSEFRKNSRR